MIDMPALREELASPDLDAMSRESITVSAMKHVLLAHSRLGTWRSDDASAISILTEAGFTSLEARDLHRDAIRLIEADGIVMEMIGSALVALIGIGTWLGWWIALPGGPL